MSGLDFKNFLNSRLWCELDWRQKRPEWNRLYSTKTPRRDASPSHWMLSGCGFCGASNARGGKENDQRQAATRCAMDASGDVLIYVAKLIWYRARGYRYGN